MYIPMKIVKLAAAAVVFLSATVGVARADDFVSLCVKADQVPGVENPNAEKTCSCASGKVSAADRPVALAALKAMAAAAASGKLEDVASATANNAKGLEIMMTAEASCM